MNAFRCKRFALGLLELKEMQQICHVAELTGQAATLADAELRNRAVREFGELAQLCKDSGFEGARDAIANGKSRLLTSGNRILMASLMVELQNAEHMVMSDMWKRRFYIIPSAKTTYVEAEALFGAAVHDRFRSARQDIQEAGNCLALGCSTAAVFHLMRVVEHGLRAYASHLGVRRMVAVKKSGIKQYTPVRYSQWETILNGLPRRVDKRLARLRPGMTKQKWQEFYQTISQDLNAIREAWRNHVMHTRQEFSEADAEAVKFRVEAIMRMLSTRVREVQVALRFLRHRSSRLSISDFGTASTFEARSEKRWYGSRLSAGAFGNIFSFATA